MATEHIKVIGTATIEVRAKEGVPHYETIDGKTIMSLMRNQTGFYCTGKILPLGFDDTESKTNPITLYELSVEWGGTCECECETGGESDERLYVPIEGTEDTDYTGKDVAENDRIHITIIDWNADDFEVLN